MYTNWVTNFNNELNYENMKRSKRFSTFKCYYYE